MFKCTINVNSNTVAAVHRPVAKEGAEQLDDPQHYKMTPSIIRSTFSAECSRANRCHHFNASFILSPVRLTQLVVGLYSLSSVVALSLLYLN